MQEKDVLISHCLDNKKKALDNYMITNSSFLSADDRGLLKKAEREYSAEVDTFYFGGYEDSERAVAVFVPKMFCIDNIEEYFLKNPDECPFCLVKITKDRFSDLSHRDYLGSIMALGIKRETVGDIVLSDDCAYVFALRNICVYICENLTKAGRATLNCEICNIRDFSPKEPESEMLFASVSSLRLDNIVSAFFNLSRNNSSAVIKNGGVYVNSVQILKNDYLIKEKDKIVLRGKGKAVLDEIIGSNKKGRIHINIKKYK